MSVSTQLQDIDLVDISHDDAKLSTPLLGGIQVGQAVAGAIERSQGDIEGYMQQQGEAGARLGDVMGDLSRKLASSDEVGAEAPAEE